MFWNHSQLFPWSYETFMPPSSPMKRRLGFFGSIHMVWWSPWKLPVIGLKVRPPSIETVKAMPNV